MKRKSFWIIVFALVSFSSNIYSQRITYGVKGGLSFPGFKGGTIDNPIFNSNSFKSGIEYGLYCEYRYSTIFSFSMGVEYSRQGGLNKFEAYPVPSSWSAYGFGPYVYSNFTNDTKLNYVKIPLMVRRSWKIKGHFGAYGGIGPFAGILLNATSALSNIGDVFKDKEKTELYISPDSGSSSIFNPDQKSELNKINLGVQGIAGITYRFNKIDMLFVEAGTSYGLRSVQYQGTIGKSHTLTPTLLLGYAYTFRDRYKNRLHRDIKTDIYR